MLRKQYICKSEVDEQERTVTAVISTGAIDRDQEILSPKGADFTQYLKNPVVLWAHQYSETPVAKALWIKKGRKNITAKARFAETPQADEIYQLFKGGYLKAFSVGFLPKKWHKPDEKEIKKRPELAEVFRIYDEWELLEFSAVPVPANPEALATAVKSLEVKLSDELLSDLELDETTYVPDEQEETKKPEPVEVKRVSVPVKKILTPVVVRSIRIKQPVNVGIFTEVNLTEAIEQNQRRLLGKIY